MFFLDGVLVLSEEHRLLLAPEVGELPLERRQSQGLRVVPPDDGVDDLRAISAPSRWGCCQQEMYKSRLDFFSNSAQKVKNCQN